MAMLLEVDKRGYYFTTMTQAEVVLAIRILGKELAAMEREGKEERTVYDFHDDDKGKLK
jgi:hypothetical protein